MLAAVVVVSYYVCITIVVGCFGLLHIHICQAIVWISFNCIYTYIYHIDKFFTNLTWCIFTVALPIVILNSRRILSSIRRCSYMVWLIFHITPWMTLFPVENVKQIFRFTRSLSASGTNIMSLRDTKVHQMSVWSWNRGISRNIFVRYKEVGCSPNDAIEYWLPQTNKQKMLLALSKKQKSIQN